MQHLLSCVTAALLAIVFVFPAMAQEPPPEPAPAQPPRVPVFQRLTKADADLAVREWKDAALDPDALLLPTETEYNDPKQVDALVAAAEALRVAGAPEIWLEVGVAGQTLQVENALTAVRFYLKKLPAVRGLVVHWLFPKRLLQGVAPDVWLREFGSLGLPMIVMGDPESIRTITYTGLDWSVLRRIPKVEGGAPDLYFAFSCFALDPDQAIEALDITVVERWLDGLKLESGLPIYPALRLRTPIDRRALTLAEFESILGMIVKRRPAGVILEPLPADAKEWPRWREAFQRILRGK